MLKSQIENGKIYGMMPFRECGFNGIAFPADLKVGRVLADYLTLYGKPSYEKVLNPRLPTFIEDRDTILRLADSFFMRNVRNIYRTRITWTDFLFTPDGWQYMARIVRLPYVANKLAEYWKCSDKAASDILGKFFPEKPHEPGIRVKVERTKERTRRYPLTQEKLNRLLKGVETVSQFSCRSSRYGFLQLENTTTHFVKKTLGRLPFSVAGTIDCISLTNGMEVLILEDERAAATIFYER